MGFPIRKFLDQSLFAAPQNLSQRTTSFFASQRQGIHRIPLRHLIALIINAHPARSREPNPLGRGADPKPDPGNPTANRPGRTPIARPGRGQRPSQSIDHSFKDQFASNISESACGQAWRPLARSDSQGELNRTRLGCSLQSTDRRIRFLRNQTIRNARSKRSDTFPLYDEQQRHRPFRAMPNTRSGKPDLANSLVRTRPKPRRAKHPTPSPWWSKTGSNRRPHACKARALPTELLPLSLARPARD